MMWTVITGDLVTSSEISAERLDHILDDLAVGAKEIGNWIVPDEKPLQTSFARRGGDSWQAALNRADYSLRVSLYMRARLRAFDSDAETRIAAAIGEGEVKANRDLNSAHGPAFTESGRLIDAIKGRTFMSHASGGYLDATFRLADHISRSWTQAQARTLCYRLRPRAGPNREIAKTLGISRQAVDQALGAAGYYAVEAAMETMEPEA